PAERKTKPLARALFCPPVRLPASPPVASPARVPDFMPSTCYTGRSIMRRPETELTALDAPRLARRYAHQNPGGTGSYQRPPARSRARADRGQPRRAGALRARRSARRRAADRIGRHGGGDEPAYRPLPQGQVPSGRAHLVPAHLVGEE